MSFLIFAGIVSFVFGVLFLFSPQSIRNLSDKANKILVHIDKKSYNLRVGIGVSLILVSGLTFFIVYFLVRKYG